MSVIKLLKDCDLGKKGATVDRVPFLTAQELVAKGVAERPGPAPAKAAAPTAPDPTAKLRADLDKATADKASLAGLVAKHEETIGQLKAENTKLAAENTKLADENTKLADENTKLADENAKLADENAKLADENAKLADENAKLALDLEAATKPPAGKPAGK